MRVAYVCADPGVPVFGAKGASIHVREMLRALVDCGARVTLFAQRLGGADQVDGVSTIELPRLPSASGRSREQASLAANAELSRLLDETGPFDLIYERQSLWSFAAMEHGQRNGVPALLEVNAPLVEEQSRYRELCGRKEAEAASDRAMDAADWLLPVSEELGSMFRARTSKIVVVPNGVDPARFPVGLAATRPAAEGVFSVGFVGGLRPWHDLATLAAAFAELTRDDASMRLLIVGDGPEREKTERQLAALGPRGAVEWTGRVSPDEVPGLLASMDVAVAPYPALDPFYFSPLKIFEYMAARLPVVATRIGQIPRLIEHGQEGLLVEPGDEKGLADAIRTLGADAVLRHRMGAAGRARVEARHTWRNVAERTLELAAERGG